MINKSYLLATLNDLDRLYNSATSQKKAIYYSKLAIIELCGWIEENMDDIVLKCANRSLKDQRNKKYVKDNIIKPNSGFQDEQNFRPMLMKVIEIINLEKLETKLEKTAKITLLKTSLGNLKTKRNEVAHTFLKGATQTYNAPSRTKNDFLQIYSLLKDFDDELRKLK